MVGDIGCKIAAAGEAYGGDGDPSVHHVLELGSMPDEAAALPDDQRYKLVRCVFGCTRFAGHQWGATSGECWQRVWCAFVTRWSARGCQVDDKIVEAGRLRQGQFYASVLDEVVPGGELQERCVLDRLIHGILCLYMHACMHLLCACTTKPEPVCCKRHEVSVDCF